MRKDRADRQAPLFVDTNVFLRFLTWDDPDKAEKAEALFAKAVKGELKLATSPLAVAEIVWTLESYYQLGKSVIAEKVEEILNTPNLDCPESDTILQALDLHAASNIDFIDAYHAILLRKQGLSRIVTFDRKHFKRVSWLRVSEP